MHNPLLIILFSKVVESKPRFIPLFKAEVSEVDYSSKAKITVWLCTQALYVPGRALVHCKYNCVCTRTTLVVLNLVAELNLDPLTKFNTVYLGNR